MNYCTLFDSTYASRGISLIKSINNTHSHADVYILAMDDKVSDKILASGLKKVKVVQLNDLFVEYPVLTDLVKQRSRAEFCWTLTPYILHWCLSKLNLSECTYVDSDVYFYSSPETVFKSLESNSVIITEHNYTPEYDQSATSGKYCVQFMYFSNNVKGLEVLNWWKDRCTEWCFARVEPNRFGDQKYLDDWTSRFDSVFVPYEPGLGLAPWNIQQYSICNTNGTKTIIDKLTKKQHQLFFYHFHGIKRSQNSIWYISDYRIDADVKKQLYIPYITALLFEEALHSRIDQLNTATISLPEKISKSKILESLFLFFTLNFKKLIKDLSPYRVYSKLNNDFNSQMDHYLFVPPIKEE